MLDKVVGRYPIRLNKSINSNLALESQNRYTIIHVTPSSRSSRRIRKPITLGRRNERRYTTRTLKDAQSERKCKRTQLMLVSAIRSHKKLRDRTENSDTASSEEVACH